MAIIELRERLDDFLADLASLHQRHGAGLTGQLPVRELYASFPHLTAIETYQAVREASVDPKRSELSRKRLRILLEFLAGQLEEATAAGAIEERAHFEATASITVGTEVIPLHSALSKLVREADRDKRSAVELALGRLLLDERGPYARRIDAAMQLAHRLGASDYLALRESVSGFSARALVEHAGPALQESEDAYRDLLGHFLRKLDPLLRPRPSGLSRRHDLQRIAVAPWLLAHFRSEQLLPAVQRWLLEAGFHPTGEKRIRLDDTARPGKSERAFVAAVRVPQEVHLVITPGAGLGDASSLLHEYGHALHLAHVEEDRPVEDRRLGDASVTEAYASLFDHLLTDERWLKRYFGLSQIDAREAARAAAFNQLVLLRRHAAKLGYELELYGHGPQVALSSEYADRLQQALFVGVEPGFFLRDVDPQLYSARYLRGWALEAVVHRVLQERFDEDFWRNPEASRFLRGLFSRGQLDSADELAKELGGELDLTSAARRLVAVLAA